MRHCLVPFAFVFCVTVLVVPYIDTALQTRLQGALCLVCS